MQVSIENVGKLGRKLTVRLPSGEERQGTIFYRGVDAGFATQRDVSRTKRDIKTFEIRLKVDNKDRRLAVGLRRCLQTLDGGEQRCGRIVVAPRREGRGRRVERNGRLRQRRRGRQQPERDERET